MIDFLDNALFSIPWPWPLVIVIASMAFVALAAFLAGSLDAGGSAFAYLIGVIVLWTTRLEGFFLFILFFISCNVVGKISARMKASDKDEIKSKKGHRRDFVQVLSNGLMATIAALIWYFTSKYSALIMLGAAVAEATSDTFAGEVGRLSKKGPVSILTLTPVPAGMSGGVTTLGIIAAFFSSAMISVCWYLWFKDVTVMGALLVCLLGFAGSIIDSYLGAAVQAQYIDRKNNRLTENDEIDGEKLELSHGIRWIDNDMVNLISNVFSSVFALGMGALVEFFGKT